MYLAIMSCMCLLSLTVGVYSYGNEITETEVIVTVSTPKNFLLNDSAIFFSMNKTGDLKIFELPLKVTWFGKLSIVFLFIYPFFTSIKIYQCYVFVKIRHHKELLFFIFQKASNFINLW